ncbi:stage V sporulation protein AC [Bacillus sp. JCM 19041]|uniref:stage V sporulation protein AC n=1 Tax=Bacillus sp. JCM 19041 TaxID=1460637 RepID=UPI0009EB3C8C
MVKEMKPEEYKENILLFQPKKRIIKHGLLAFISGGTICLFGQIIFNIYHAFFQLTDQTATSYMLVTLIGLTALSTGIGIFKKGAQLFGAGLIVPISGFANAMTSTALEHQTEGLLSGIGVNLFRLVGPILMIGIAAAYIVSFSRLLIQMLLQ